MEPKNEKLNNNNTGKSSSQIEEFNERSYEEVEDGYYDDRGFYTTPNGSFWDDNHTYFNHLGFDKNNGYYVKYGLYHPGYNYNYDLDCYDDEIDKEFINNFNQINTNNLKDLEEHYLINKVYEKEIDFLNDDNENEEKENEENENDDLNDEEMERIYNECVSISKKKDPSLQNELTIKDINQNNLQESQENLKNINEKI